MYRMPVNQLYVTDSVADDPRAMHRAKRLAAGLGVDDPPVVTRAQAIALHNQRPAEQPHPFPRRTGAFDYSQGWNILLDTYIDGDRLRGGIPRTSYRNGSVQMDGQGVCQSALELHAAFGCFHRCAYCFVDPWFLIACDLESLAERIPEYCRQYPTQKLFKFDNFTDTIALEPEYGASELLVPLFARLDDRYLLLYTKSNNVDHLLALDHGGHTIVNWSLSPWTQSREVERGTPHVRSRIEAMRKCARAGYKVRARISPVVPLEGWRKESSELADMLFDAVQPDVVTIDVVGWCVSEALAEVVDVAKLEAPFRQALHAGVGVANLNAQKYLFSHELRRSVLHHVVSELKRRSPRTPVALCNETRQMWDDLADLLVMRPEHYACCCGPDSVPGNALLAQARD